MGQVRGHIKGHDTLNIIGNVVNDMTHQRQLVEQDRILDRTSDWSQYDI